ncbi:hypothetical protein SAMN04487980_104815 [Streptomyces sp. cf124]|uniref:hypothetical protein n=1 Tax=Streptomyces sp. cf124 TaxID=1761903 RepID=UPI0008EBBCA2|nr:hypothetical protein [Streptomyces sp. cf124]SFO04043.1 hypothetical protein SAMN04487980_104815 [Streptomyces sp. cf124]
MALKRQSNGLGRSAVAVTAVAFVAVLGTGTTAHAGASCGVTGCSSSVNDTSVGATALKNWCRGGDSTGASTDKQPTCKSDDVPQKSMYLSPNGGHTPYREDWDTLRVDAGWCYKVRFIVDFGDDFNRTYDRRGLSAAYVKAADNADAHVIGQSTSSCP